MKNVFIDLQSRQWRQVEGLNVRELVQFSEEKALLGLKESWSCHSVVENKQSTLALAFSCDGNFMASSHLTHEIVIQKTRPFLHILRILSAHPSTNRSPWCLTFHPSCPHHLLSGSLGGSVLLWDVLTGKCLCAWVSGIYSPINSLVFLPTHPDYFLVAYDTRLCLMHCCDHHKMETVWSSKTAAPEVKVRLVHHHPDYNKILTAVTNHIPHATDTTYGYSRRSSYRLQMYPYSFTSSPDLENSSAGLLSMSVRVLSPQSVVLTSQLVISTSVDTSSTKLSVYSIDQHTFGQCLYSITLPRNMSVVSLDLSESERFLLMSSSRKKPRYCSWEPPHKSRVKVFRMIKNVTSVALEPYCELSGMHSTNMARWLPSQSGEGGVCVGTQHGSVVRWGRKKEKERVGEKAEEVSRDFKLDWFYNITAVS